MKRKPTTDDDVELVPIPLDRETIARLARLGRLVDDHPMRIAGSILHDVLKDDEDAHILDAATLN